VSDTSSLRVLYPDIEPFSAGFLRVSPLHTIYFEQSGNPNGKAVLFVHGGPGGATSHKQRRYFDPNAYRIILFDQRGCGKSLPHACLEENTTWKLVEDMEALRKHLSVDRWQLFGGSWGSTLSLAYAEIYPERVAELILRGIFLLRKSEISWFYQSGANNIFPDAWEEYVGCIPRDEHEDLLLAYYRRLTGADAEARQRAAAAWSRWEMATSFLVPQEDYIRRADNDNFAAAFSRIECHYFVNGGFFFPEGQLLDEIGKIRHIPGVIVQGRYDVVCPMRTAWDLHRAWPEADFKLVPAAGHSAYEKVIVHELVNATDQFR
jgi:proline iminopeptidase